MPRRRRMVQGVESSQDLARKLEVLERELAVQRTAMEKLKQLGPPNQRRPARAAQDGVRDRTGTDRIASGSLVADPDPDSFPFGDSPSRRRSSASITSGAHGFVSTWRIPVCGTDRAVRDTRNAGHRKNRNRARDVGLLQRTTELEAVHAWNREIGQHDVRPELLRLRQRLMAIVRVDDPEAAAD